MKQEDLLCWEIYSRRLALENWKLLKGFRRVVDAENYLRCLRSLEPQIIFALVFNSQKASAEIVPRSDRKGESRKCPSVIFRRSVS